MGLVLVGYSVCDNSIICAFWSYAYISHILDVSYISFTMRMMDDQHKVVELRATDKCFIIFF